MLAGVVIVLIGAALVAAGKAPWLGALPGDIRWRGEKWSVSFPVVTCILVSIVLTVIVNVLLRLFHR